MTACIEGLLELCRKQPFDVDEIQGFIKSNNMSSEDVTRAVLKLCDEGMFSYKDYLDEHGKEPQPGDLCTYNWELLFNVLMDNGLDASLVIPERGFISENVLSSIRYFDDGDLGARILRNILSKGFSPDIRIDHMTLFEEVDDNLMTDIGMDLYNHKWQLDNAFRFWLVLVGFGGVLRSGKLPVDMCDGYSPQIFKKFEKFDYDIVRFDRDFELRIIEKETNTLVATA